MNKQLIVDLLVTAFESISFYWATVSIKHVTRREGMSSYENMALDIIEGKNVFIVRDAEDPTEILGVLSVKTLKEGIALFKGSFPEFYGQCSDGEWDAETADVFLQCITMKEIVFG